MQFLRIHFAARLLTLFVAIWVIGCGGQSSQEDAQKPATPATIVFMTDFGTANPVHALGRGIARFVATRVPSALPSDRKTKLSRQKSAAAPGKPAM